MGLDGYLENVEANVSFSTVTSAFEEALATQSKAISDKLGATAVWGASEKDPDVDFDHHKTAVTVYARMAKWPVNTYVSGEGYKGVEKENVRVTVANLYLSEMPGCCGALVSHNSSVADQFRRKGIGKLLLEAKEKAALLAGYTMMLATVLQDNKGERALLASMGWSEMYGFKSIRTGNTIVMYRKLLLAENEVKL